MTKTKKLTQLVNFVCRPEDYEKWKAQAKAMKISWGEFAREAVAAYSDSLPNPEVITVRNAAREVKERSVAKKKSIAKKKEHVEVSNLLQAAKSAPTVCDNRLPAGAFCKRCGRIHK